ncbi:MAG: hypothetical protein AAGF12_23820, partial [Myxococcota bacterium]
MITFLGVRHHSPACAGLVRTFIREQRPSHILIEGPADMNPRLDELALPHRLPIAIFSFFQRDGDNTEHRADDRTGDAHGAADLTADPAPDETSEPDEVSEPAPTLPRQLSSWAPFCDYSPEWVALT